MFKKTGRQNLNTGLSPCPKKAAMKAANPDNKRDKKAKRAADRMARKAARRKRPLILRILAVTAQVILTAALAAVAAVLIIDLVVTGTTRRRIMTADDEKLAEMEDVDAVIVLGCSVRPGGVPSAMLADRIDAGVEALANAPAKLLLMSGDRHDYYDEPGVMLRCARERGVPEEMLGEDPEGFSTFESVVRAAKTFGFRRVIIVSQRYHLYRALYIADRAGLEAYGVTADPRTYSGQAFREMREVAARVKDFFQCMFRI